MTTIAQRLAAAGIEVKPLGHILRDEYARLVVKNEAADAARILAALQIAPEPSCPHCRSHHFARCDDRREDGKWHSGSILRCIECKTNYLDPALAASPEVQTLIAAAETRGWNAAIEAAIEACVTEYLEDPNPGSEGDVAYQHAVADCFTAIRALKKGE